MSESIVYMLLLCHLKINLTSCPQRDGLNSESSSGLIFKIHFCFEIQTLLNIMKY